MSGKYYAVAVGRKPGIYRTWEDCKAQTDGFSNAKFKSFKTEDEAKMYLKKIKAPAKRPVKVCQLCLKPIASRGEICPSCTKKKHRLETKMFEYSLGRTNKISNLSLIFLKEKYNTEDVFDLLDKQPYLHWNAFCTSRDARREIKKDHKKYFRDNPKYQKDEKIPGFVSTLFEASKEVLKVSGNRTNPNIIYKCKRCGETLFTRYYDYLGKSGHDCAGIKSSGEIIVEEFLKSKALKYKTQRDTLQCINPDTGHVMPYDFELVGKKILIEVQGEQHRSFIPRFHVTEEGFEYQKEKDAYKKKFAEAQGYKLIEIWYDEFENDAYKHKILEVLGIEPLYLEGYQYASGS